MAKNLFIRRIFFAKLVLCFPRANKKVRNLWELTYEIQQMANDIDFRENDREKLLKHHLAYQTTRSAR